VTATGSIAPAMPSWFAAAHTRNLASLVLHRLYRLQAHGSFHVGTEGPLVLVVPSRSPLAGLMVQAVAPRPVHVVAQAEPDATLPAGLVRATGGIAVDTPTAIAAQHDARAALEDGRAVAVCGSTDAVPYLVSTTHAPVMPVVLLGADGRLAADPPAPRTRIDAYFVPPVHVEVPGDPLRTTTRAAVAEQVRQLVADATDHARRRAGLTEVGG